MELRFNSNGDAVRIPSGGMTVCLERYRDWATAMGFPRQRSYEPDLDGAAGFSDRDFVVTIQDRSPYVTLTVQAQDDS